MLTWMTSKEVSTEDLDKSLENLRVACFKCGKELHERYEHVCPIATAIKEINKLKGS